MKRNLIRSVLEDAVLDREGYLDAVGNVPEYVPQTERHLERLRGLLDRYRGDARVLLSEDDRETLRLACGFALLWREGLLDANSNSTDKAYLRSLRTEIRVARDLYTEMGGVPRAPLGELIPVTAIWEKGIGTHVVETDKDGGKVRDIRENNIELGRIETDADGVVRVFLPGGKIVNQPFETAWDAQDWLLGKYSKNMLFRRADDEEEEPSFSP